MHKATIMAEVCAFLKKGATENLIYLFYVIFINPGRTSEMALS